MTRRSPVPVLALAASVLLVACGDGDGGGTQTPVPSAMQKTGGDGQSGAPGTTLQTPLEVKVTDDNGTAVPDFTVSFSASAGTLSPQAMDTDASGRARTTLTLPDADGTVTVTASGAGVPSVTFTAESVAEQLSFVTSVLPAGRTGIGYGQAIEATGGAGGYTFEITSGALPGGMVLENDGSFSGAPTQTGNFPLTVRVSDGEGESASRAFTLNTCAVPADMAVGDVQVLETSPVGQCGLWLPNDEDGRYYRVGLIRTNRTGSEGGEREATATVFGNGVTAVSPAGGPFRVPSASAGALSLPRGALLRDLAGKRETTARLHATHLREAEAMLRRLGPSAVARPGQRPLGVAAADLPDKLRIDVTNSSACQAGEQVTAVKIMEDDRLAIYQDSAQHADVSSRVTTSQAGLLLGYYEDHGREVIDTYFGGVDDIDGNGKVIVFVTPQVSENVLGFVWPGDMFRKSQCAASNEAELIYLGVDQIHALTDVDGIGLALSTLVHEMKHVASVYERLQRTDQQLHPLWMEEGGAEIASTAAARDQWAEVGGPGYTEQLVEDHWRDQASGGVTSENVAVFLQLFRLQAALFEHPNSIIVNTGNGDDVYGTGWLFLQWLADAYGEGATAPFADAPLFSQLTTRTTVSGVAGIEAVTGASWETLLAEFVAAAMYNGTPEVGPKPIVRYDFISAWELFCVALDPHVFDQQPQDSACRRDGGQPGPPGAFPWPVTTNSSGSQQHKLLQSAVFRGQTGQGGFRVHDFRTNGTGFGAEVNVHVQSPAKVVVVRIQ